MYTVQQLTQALEQARGQGFSVRTEWLGGGGGGDCEIRGKRWLFLDHADNPAEQLEQVLAVLARIELRDVLLVAASTRHGRRKVG